MASITPAEFCGECPYWNGSEEKVVENGVEKRRCEWLRKLLPANCKCTYYFDPEEEPSMEQTSLDEEEEFALQILLDELGIAPIFEGRRR